MDALFTECNTAYQVWDEQDDPFTADWMPWPFNVSAKEAPINSAWRFRGVLEADGVPHAGKLAVYGGGGYILDLIGNGTTPVSTAMAVFKETL